MSFELNCPNCGPRPVWEFHYGGPPRQRPGPEATDRQWAAYLYDRANVCGEQTEWWYHRSACKLWFLVRRNTRNNQVLESRRYAPQEGTSG